MNPERKSKVNYPTSPNLPTSGDIVHTDKEFSDALTLELTDEEIQKAFAIVAEVSFKYQYKEASVKNLEALEDEIKTRLTSIGILASVNPMSLLDGDPVTVDFIGKVKNDPFHTYGLDHEKKKFEVEKANTRGEDYLGQREPANKRRAK
jgi:FKBP-type peptidyl-prolyl cis-trans isomerase (trigger factor)